MSSPEAPDQIGNSSSAWQQRVHVLAPFGSDAALICQVLYDAGIDARPCESVGSLCHNIRLGGAAAVVAEEAVDAHGRAILSATLADEPAWSDFPLVLLTSQLRNSDDGWAAMHGIEGTAHLTLLDRPLRTATLLTAVQVAVHARQRQYRVRDELAARLEAENRLDQSLAQLSALFHHMTEGLILFDLEGNLLDMNPAALATHGFDTVEGLRRNLVELPEIWELRDLEGRRLPVEAWPIGRVLRGETFSRYEVEVRRCDTGTSWIGSYGGTPVYDQQGRLLLAIVTLRDITAEYEAEKKLVAARAEAERANRAKSQFLANMSHELRTPMNAVLGMTNLALREELSPTVRDQLETVRDSGTVLLELLNDLLDFSRIEAGRVALEKRPFPLRETVAKVISTLGVRAAEKGLELSDEIAPDVPDNLIGDALRLRQVLVNLVGNAIKFTERGHVTVAVDVESRRGQTNLLRFAVSDTGIGIAPEELQRIFSPFTQANASTTREYGGTGLGLSIVRNLVKMMGGQMHVESAPGKGSTFAFSIRLRRAATAGPEEGRGASGEGREGATDGLASSAESPQPAAVRADLPGGEVKGSSAERSLRMLLVEDMPANQKLVGYLLSARGHEFDVAANGREAVDRVSQGEYDVVLMDVQMPVMDGLEAAVEIRKLPEPEKAGVPIIAMTAHALEGDAERCLAAGMNDYLSKPIVADRLIGLLEELGAPRAASKDDGGSESAQQPADVDPAVFDPAEAVRVCFNREEMFHCMVDGFLGEADPLLAEIRSAVGRQDVEAVEDASHRLKNTVLYLAAPAAQDASEHIQRLARRGQLADAPAAVERISVEIQKLKAAVQAHRSEQGKR